MSPKQGHGEPMLILNINIVNSIFSDKLIFFCSGRQKISFTHRDEEGDAAVLGYTDPIVRITGIGEGRVSQGEQHSSMTIPVAVEHPVFNVHRNFCETFSHFDQSNAAMMGILVLFIHGSSHLLGKRRWVFHPILSSRFFHLDNRIFIELLMAIRVLSSHLP